VFNVILYQPEIPPNSGNIIRLCANTGSKLHFIEPLGFQLDSARLKRAGLDFHELAECHRHRDWPAFREKQPDMRIWAFSTRAQKRYDQGEYQPGDGLLFGPETRGLPGELMRDCGDDFSLRLPMMPNSRSMNLSNTVAVGLYEALRQTGFQQLK